MVATFGLDFGTTNSVATVVRFDDGSKSHRASSFLQNGRPHPSVVWYPGDRPIAGQKAMEQLEQLGLGVYGDIVRSPKMYLGGTTGIFIGGVQRSTVDVVADLISHVRTDALHRDYGGNLFESAVVTIPVSMDGNARAELRSAALKAGIRVHRFVHEPLAALYGYLRPQQDFAQSLAVLERKLVLVFDWGGGTLDLTLCQIQDGLLTQVRNLGDREVGGDQFDNRLRQLVRKKHEDQYPLIDWAQAQPKSEARLIRACEDAKIALSSRSSTTIFVPNFLASSGPEKDIYVTVSLHEFQALVGDLVSTGLGTINTILDSAGVHRGAIEFCLATGGMISIPAIRDGLREIFGISQMRLIDNGPTIISEGAAWIAFDQVELKLAKPIEVLHADNTYVEIVPAHTGLPTAGESISTQIDMYCVDTSDGHAKFLFARPEWPGRQSQGERRVPYAHLTLPVDRRSRPFFERLKVELMIDHNLVADIRAHSLMRGESRRASVYDLEFGLGTRAKSSSASA